MLKQYQAGRNTQYLALQNTGHGDTETNCTSPNMRCIDDNRVKTSEKPSNTRPNNNFKETFYYGEITYDLQGLCTIYNIAAYAHCMGALSSVM